MFIKHAFETTPSALILKLAFGLFRFKVKNGLIFQIKNKAKIASKKKISQEIYLVSQNLHNKPK